MQKHGLMYMWTAKAHLHSLVSLGPFVYPHSVCYSLNDQPIHLHPRVWIITDHKYVLKTPFLHDMTHVICLVCRNSIYNCIILNKQGKMITNKWLFFMAYKGVMVRKSFIAGSRILTSNILHQPSCHHALEGIQFEGINIPSYGFNDWIFTYMYMSLNLDGLMESSITFPGYSQSSKTLIKSWPNGPHLKKMSPWTNAFI